MSTTLSSISIPTCYTQAMEHECWQKAMEVELQALEENHTWDIVSCPPNVKPIGSKWVYTVKLKSYGSLDRYKARLVVLGNKQEYGLDYEETFAAAKMTIVRTILAIKDIIITGNDSGLIFKLQNMLHSIFQMKDLGHLTYFLGLEVHSRDHGLFLNQHKYIQDLIELAGLKDAMVVDTPMEVNVKY